MSALSGWWVFVVLNAIISFTSFTEGYGVSRVLGIKLPWVNPDEKELEWIIYDYPQSVRDEMDAIIRQLTRPLDAADQADGWAEESAAAIMRYFEARRVNMEAGTVVSDPGLARGLAAWGVDSGALYDRIIHLNDELPQNDL